MVKGKFAAVATVALLVSLLSGPAFAQYEFPIPPFGPFPTPTAPATAPPTVLPSVLPTANVTDATLVQGGVTTVFGSGWGPARVFFTFFSSPVALGGAAVNAAGEFSAQVTIPGDSSVGRHTIRVSGVDRDGHPASVDIPIQVVGEEAAAGAIPAGGLALTGSNITVGMVILAGLVVIGVSAMVAGRRRSKTAA